MQVVLTKEKEMAANTTKVTIHSCQTHIQSGAFQHAQDLKEISMQSLHALTLDSESFNLSQSSGRISINISNTTVAVISSDTFNLNDAYANITFSDCGIQMIREKAFMGRMHILQFNNSIIGITKTQAFYQLTSSKIIFSKSRVHEFNQHSFNKCEINELHLVKNKIDKIHQEAFMLEDSKLQEIHILENRFENVSKHFIASASKYVWIQGNRFDWLDQEAFNKIKLKNDESYNIYRFSFVNNTVEKFKTGALLLQDSKAAQIDETHFHIPCDCEYYTRLSSLLQANDANESHIQEESPYYRIFDLLYHTSSCLHSGGKYKRILDYDHEVCLPMMNKLENHIIYLIPTVTVALLITIIVLVVIVWKYHMNQRKIVETISKNLEEEPAIPRLIFAFPETRTYQETEIDIVSESTNPINNDQLHQLGMVESTRLQRRSCI